MQNLEEAKFPNPHLPHLLFLPDQNQSSASFHSSLTWGDAFLVKMTHDLLPHARHCVVPENLSFLYLIFQDIFASMLRLELLLRMKCFLLLKVVNMADKHAFISVPPQNSNQIIK